MSVTAFFLAIFLSSSALSQEPLKVIYPWLLGSDDRQNYQVQLLKLALEKSGQPYEIQQNYRNSTQARMMRQLETGEEITVAWVGTNTEYEHRFKPVRIPLLRGLLGYRVFIIHKNNQIYFSKVRTLRQLQEYSVGQGIGWSDIEILESGGFQVASSPYDILFKLIANERLHLFPRGFMEAYPEVATQIELYPNLAVEQDLLLVYPFAMFFFVHKDNQRLHDAIYDGLRAAYADGSFMELFNNHPEIQPLIKRADLSNRRRFDIPNPILSEETKSIADIYWHQLENTK